MTTDALLVGLEDVDGNIIAGIDADRAICLGRRGDLWSCPLPALALSPKSLALFRERARVASSQLSPCTAPMQDMPLGIVCLMGNVGVVGHIAQRARGYIEVLPLGAESSSTYGPGAIYSLKTDVPKVSIERLLEQRHHSTGLTIFNCLDEREIYRVIEGEGTDGRLPTLGMVVETRESRVRWHVTHVHNSGRVTLKDGTCGRILDEEQWHAKVYRIHQDFPEPCVGLRLRWKGPRLAAIEGTVVASQTIQYLKPNSWRETHEERQATVLVLEDGRRLPMRPDGERSHGDWDVLALPDVRQPLPKRPTVHLGQLPEGSHAQEQALLVDPLPASTEAAGA